ncbi:MAG: hypothetical protein QOH57_218, partial [Mycobacterium sp.]|nr:hypothetical protein [Mycobacterium sp.]
MRVIADPEERDLASTCRRILGAECPTTLARALKDVGAERMPAGLWKALADAGVLGLAIDESLGGSGGNLSDLGVFSIEAGRALCPTVVHSTLYAARAIDWLCVPAARSAWLPLIASGAVRGTAAVSSPRDAADVAPVLDGRADSDGWRLRGVADFVADADLADFIVVTANAGGRALACVVETGARGVSIDPVPMMGGHRGFTVHFDDVAVDEAADVREQGIRRVANAAVALSCLDLVGVGEAVVQRTVDYTKMRQQFGRPIASFQAAQHMVADMHIALAAARLTAHAAVFWIGRGTATRETAIARIRADAVKQITLNAHQLHGGMGYV